MTQPLYAVQYNIPRFVVGVPGRQFRATGGDMRVSPGHTEPMEFIFGNMDGVPINLVAFRIRLVFWYQPNQYDKLSANPDQNSVVLTKDVEVKAPYEGKCVVILSDEDTEILGRSGRGTLRWSLYLINDDNQTFPAQITAHGDRYGLVQIEQSGMPSGETVRSLAPSR